MIKTNQCFQREDGLTRLTCLECSKSFLVAEPKEIFKCPHCLIITGNSEAFVPTIEYLRDSREWY